MWWGLEPLELIVKGGNIMDNTAHTLHNSVTQQFHTVQGTKLIPTCSYNLMHDFCVLYVF